MQPNAALALTKPHANSAGSLGRIRRAREQIRQMRSNVRSSPDWDRRRNSVGQATDVFDDIADFYGTPYTDRKVYRYITLEYDLLSLPAQQDAIQAGLFTTQTQPEPQSGVLQASHEGTGITFGGCNLVLGSIRGKAYATPDANVINVAWVPSDPEETPDSPVFRGVVPHSGLPSPGGEAPDYPTAIAGQIWNGRPAQMALYYFLKSHNVVIYQCGNLIANIPLCAIVKWDCGVTFEGASDSLEPVIQKVREVNDRLLELGIEIQGFPQNIFGTAGIPPVEAPTTYGSPSSQCPGYYDFIKPVIPRADAPLMVTIEVNENCAHDVAEFARWTEQSLDTATNPSARFTGRTAILDAQTKVLVLKVGAWCIELEFQGCQLTKRGIALCWQKYWAEESEEVCSKCFDTVVNTCGLVPNHKIWKELEEVVPEYQGGMREPDFARRKEMMVDGRRPQLGP